MVAAAEAPVNRALSAILWGMQQRIVVRGARQHNLKGIDLDLPRGALIVMTGVSGSGKSTLALDTIYAEGQRKYVESLSAYARQFLQQMQKPEVDHIEGLSPAIAIQQRPLAATPRSTVATATEIHDYLRLLYANSGTPHCPRCRRPVRRMTVQEMVDEILALPSGEGVQILARVADGARGNQAELLARLAQDGFVRVRVDGAYGELGALPRLDARARHTVDVVVDRVAVRPEARNRITDSLELALRTGGGSALVLNDRGLVPAIGGAPGEGGAGGGTRRRRGRASAPSGTTPPGEERLFSERMLCRGCGTSYAELAPSSFSFNSPHGACPSCHGLGRQLAFDPARVIDPKKSLAGGAVRPFRIGGKSLVIYYRLLLRAVAKQFEINPDTPFEDLGERERELVLRGSGGEAMTMRFWRGRRPCVRTAPFEGVLPILDRRFRETESEWMRRVLRGFMAESLCGACGGLRLRPEALAVTVAGKGIGDLLAMTADEALAFVRNVSLEGRARAAGAEPLREIAARLGFLGRVGLGYLTLDRESGTLSGGEAQRTRLATQIGAGLTGVLYVLDEPSIGLHPRDTARLLETLARLRDLGNTVIVIEHDEATIRAADHVVDLGPGAGIHGGAVVAQGTVAEIAASPASLTGQYLSGSRRIELPETRRAPEPGRALLLAGASHNNLKDIDVRIPLGLLCAVTGVSGAGKSSLVDDTLRPALQRRLHGSTERAGAFRALSGAEQVDKVVVIDQSPIGRTPRSNPATYTGVYDAIRGLFAKHPEARARGYGPGRFSFNVKGGRCEACRGDGILRVEMHFLPDVYVPCEACGGKRYNRETLEVRFKGKTIADVLAMTVEEALAFFQRVPVLARRLGILSEVGLGYLELGQPATTLSGGEAQRIKLSRELGGLATGSTLYILDEPTTGLHFADIRILLGVLRRLVDAGNTVLVVEHNLEVVKCADWVIDLGPEGGEAGGRIVAEGTPERIAACPGSHTGRHLRGHLAR